VLRATNKPELGFTVKNYQERRIALHPQLAEMLRAERELGKGEWVCSNDRHGQWSLAVSRWVNAAFQAAGFTKAEIDERGTCHRFRHSFATNSVRSGMDLGTAARDPRAFQPGGDVAIRRGVARPARRRGGAAGAVVRGFPTSA
jgi:integrase